MYTFLVNCAIRYVNGEIQSDYLGYEVASVTVVFETDCVVDGYNILNWVAGVSKPLEAQRSDLEGEGVRLGIMGNGQTLIV